MDPSGLTVFTSVFWEPSSIIVIVVTASLGRFFLRLEEGLLLLEVEERGFLLEEGEVAVKFEVEERGFLGEEGGEE
jgi:hypothetical protein